MSSRLDRQYNFKASGVDVYFYLLINLDAFTIFFHSMP